MENLLIIADKNRVDFERKILKVPLEKITGEPEFEKTIDGVMTYSVLVKMTPEEIANL
ncbi:hypothetical protein [uncultured Clostridium sp.]|uniref:hypothetical protein n=1 Tax=uncultured Clostridium sp. TaxID=59620 RepID=UPI00260ACB99|nr:hypothetical protein [uncultured Clostridium sp.]